MTKDDAILKLIELAIKGAKAGGVHVNPVDVVHEVMSLCEIAGIIATELEEGV